MGRRLRFESVGCGPSHFLGWIHFFAALPRRIAMRFYIKISAAVAAAMLLSACATTQVASAEERAQCEQMAAQMGVSPSHDRREVKGQPRSAMNKMHERCRKILRDQA
jgi:hypothetical protein